ncbi:MAG: nucleotidyltransferase family protein [Clostridia bacterium]|nr:nucleotidyltransferase family protein [Clostridia bacterium]
MATVGIIAEFNPLHKGHEYLICEAKKLGQVVTVISGNFVQRGDTAIASKEIRAKAALKSGIDLVAELPVLWSMSTAQNFALGGISALVNLGCDTLIFGSECGDIKPLIKIADILTSSKFPRTLEKHLSEGITFATARQRACEELGAQKGILDKPNNNLGIEYIVAAKKLGANLQFKTVKRKGTQHDSLEIGEFVSATLLREKLLQGDREFCRKYMSEEILKLFTESELSDIKRLETGVLTTLRAKSKSEFRNLPDLSEGVENKLYFAIRLATSLDMLYNEIKVKRYPLARVRRLVLSAFLGLNNSYFLKPLPYIRVLGFNNVGKEILKNATPKVPIITKVSEIKDNEVFLTEAKTTDLYNLSLKSPKPSGSEYTFKLITED